jgi:hypothetical protein
VPYGVLSHANIADVRRGRRAGGAGAAPPFQPPRPGSGTAEGRAAVLEYPRSGATASHGIEAGQGG